MVLNNYRHLLPRFINGPTNFCIKRKITPNQISIIGFVFSVLAGITFAFPQIFLYNHSVIVGNLWWWWACIPPWLFFFSGYIDVLDGSVARKTGTASKYGAFLDSTLDRIADAVTLLGLMVGQMIWPWNITVNYLIGFTTLSIMFLISYTRSRAELEGVEMKGIGFMERAERYFLMIFIFVIEWAVFAIEEQFFGGAKTRWVFPTLFIIYTLLCTQTLIKRFTW
ncbi:MAG: CDP-alcohol phosphatidyltransferase family protein, partial [Promethearchaeota archaeon]